MSTATLPPTVTGAGDDFPEWESELADTTTYLPSKAAQRREAQAVIDQQLGHRRHRTHEREV